MFRVISILLWIGTMAYLFYGKHVNAQNGVWLKPAIGVSKMWFEKRPDVNDFHGYLPIQGYFDLQLGLEHKGLNFFVNYSKFSMTRFKYKFEACSCNGDILLNGNKRLGIGFSYNLRFGESRVSAFGGIAFDRESSKMGGIIGKGNPYIPFPDPAIPDDQYQVLLHLTRLGFDAGMHAGIRYYISPKVQAIVDVGYTRWIGQNPRMKVDIAYHSNQANYKILYTDSGQTLMIGLGLRMLLHGS